MTEAPPTLRAPDGTIPYLHRRTADPLVNPRRTLEFAHRLPAERTTVIRGAEWAHELNQEIDRCEVFRTVVEWMEQGSRQPGRTDRFSYP